MLSYRRLGNQIDILTEFEVESIKARNADYYRSSKNENSEFISWIQGACDKHSGRKIIQKLFYQKILKFLSQTAALLQPHPINNL